MHTRSNRQQPHGPGKSTTTPAAQRLHILSIDCGGFLPPEQQAEMVAIRAALRAAIDAKRAGPAIVALEIILGETIGATVWRGRDLAAELFRSRMFVETVARSVAAAAAGEA